MTPAPDAQRQRCRLSRRLAVLLALLALVLGAAWLVRGRLDVRNAVRYVFRSRGTVADRLGQYGPAARTRWAPYFERAGVTYPPKDVCLLAVKDRRVLQVYADSGSGLRRVRELDVLGASGRLGPKQRRGDNQVPEGIYEVESLNPNSHFHLALRVSYPNAFDQKMGQADKREDLGGDIMIHGGSASAGCLAMGDEAAEDLFVLAAETGIEHVRVIITPVDFRYQALPVFDRPAWSEALYSVIASELRALPD